MVYGDLSSSIAGLYKYLLPLWSGASEAALSFGKLSRQWRIPATVLLCTGYTKAVWIGPTKEERPAPET